MIELPPTIRTPRPGEMRHRHDMAELLEKRANANIRQGFAFHINNNTKFLPYTFSAEININNSRLWQLFLNLAEDLPEKITINFGLEKEEKKKTLQGDKQTILTILGLFKPAVTQECAIEISMVSNTPSAIHELHIAPLKYLRFFGMVEQTFRDKMKAFGISEIRRLEFIDEYPFIIMPLQSIDRSQPTAVRIIEHLNESLEEKLM